MLPASLLVVHDTGGGGEDNVAELTRGQEFDNPLLNLVELDVVAGRDTSALVDTAVKLNDNLSGSVVVNLLELADVTVSLHDTQELDDDLRRGSDEDLSLASLLGIVDGVQAVVENRSLDHSDGGLSQGMGK